MSHSLASVSKSKPIFGAAPDMFWGLGIILLEVTAVQSQGQELFGYLARVT